jgi:hypothetical protein
MAQKSGAVFVVAEIFDFILGLCLGFLLKKMPVLRKVERATLLKKDRTIRKGSGAKSFMSYAQYAALKYVQYLRGSQRDVVYLG